MLKDILDLVSGNYWANVTRIPSFALFPVPAQRACPADGQGVPQRQEEPLDT